MILAEDELALAQTDRLIGKVELGPAQLTTRLSHLIFASQKLYAHPEHPVHPSIQSPIHPYNRPSIPIAQVMYDSELL
jgi:hypothetical protein